LAKPRLQLNASQEDVGHVVVAQGFPLILPIPCGVHKCKGARTKPVLWILKDQRDRICTNRKWTKEWRIGWSPRKAAQVGAARCAVPQLPWSLLRVESVIDVRIGDRAVKGHPIPDLVDSIRLHGG